MSLTSTLIVTLIIFSVSAQELYNCLSGAFQSQCRSQLYQCTNNPECSYQLHQNTKHIFVTKDTENFPQLYFSNQIARNFYLCLQKQCKLPPIDEAYPKTLPFDSCLMQVYDICRGNIQDVFENPTAESLAHVCYRKHCTFPNILSQ